jgi:hypothetical protein
MVDFLIELFGLDHLVGRLRGWMDSREVCDALPGSTPPSRGVALFLRGSSVRRAAAALYPGVGGPQMIATQDAIERQIRSYVMRLGRENEELRRENAALRQELAELAGAISD